MAHYCCHFLETTNALFDKINKLQPVWAQFCWFQQSQWAQIYTSGIVLAALVLGSMGMLQLNFVRQGYNII